MKTKAVQVTHKCIGGVNGVGGINWYKPYTQEDKGDFKILWPNKENFKDYELEAMIRAFGTGFIIVDQEGNELRRVP